MTRFYPRWQKATIKQLLSERRVLLLTGPRQSGKTTLARELESDRTEYRTLDDGTLREAAENDPQGFIKRRKKTLIIDEGFGSQDEEGLAQIMDAIHKIQDDFLKVIIVSHLTSMKDQFPIHLVVQKGANGSRVNIIELG